MSNRTGVVRVEDKRNGMGIMNNKIIELNLSEEIKSGEKILVGDPKGLKNKEYISAKALMISSKDDVIELGRFENKFKIYIGCNVLVEGKVGSGKTYLLKSIVEQTLISDKNNKCYVISRIKENEFKFGNNHISITELATEKEDVLKLLISLNKEVYRRQNIRDISKLGRVTVVIDELFHITKATEFDKDKSISIDIIKELAIFASLGRDIKMNLIISRNSSYSITESIERGIETRIVAGDRVGDFKLDK